MHWVLQVGLEAGHSEEAMIDTVKELGLPHTVVEVVPFSHELQPEPQLEEQKVIAYGSTTLAKVSQERRWTPGVYYDKEAFHFENLRNHWKSSLLNWSAVVTKFGEVKRWWDRFFIRPAVSEKIFTGSYSYNGSEVSVPVETVMWLRNQEGGNTGY